MPVVVEENNAPVIGIIGVFDLGVEDVDVVSVCKGSVLESGVCNIKTN